MRDFSSNSGPESSDDSNSAERYLTRRERQQLKRGLPSDSALEALAETYLSFQNEHWSGKVAAGQLLENTPDNIHHLVGEFKASFLSDSNAFPEPGGARANCAYVRFSDDNSNERSLAQQLKNILVRALQDGKFIEWQHICADAAITATSAFRRGYQQLVHWLENHSSRIEVVYFDDLSRLNRNVEESVRLENIARDNKVLLIGVKDGVDTSNPYSKVMNLFNALQQESFVDSLIEKVKRGMADAFEQDKVLQPPCIGYKLVLVTNAQNAPVLNAKGKVVRSRVVDPQNALIIRQIFEWFVVDHKSRSQIAKLLNSQRAGGSATWDSTRVKQILERSVYRGIEYYGMTSQKRARQTDKVKVIKHPREKWLERSVPHLQIVSAQMWEKAQERLESIRRVYTKKTDPECGEDRSSHFPKVLIKPFCGYCNVPLHLAHSEKYKSFSCHHGSGRKNGCRLTSCKSEMIINSAILSILGGEVVTPEFFNEVVEQANRELERILSEPPKDLTPQLERLDKLKSQEKKLQKLLLEEDDVEAIRDALRELQTEKRTIERHLEQAEKDSVKSLPPIEAQFVKTCLADVEKLIKSEPGIAAPILAALTGPIQVTEGERVKGRRGVPWIAEFTVNMTRFLVELGRYKKYPTTGTWEFLNTRGWTISKTVNLEVKEMPVYERRGQEYARMRDAGHSIEEIARKYGMNQSYVSAAIVAYEGGSAPEWGKICANRISTEPPQPTWAELIGEDVIRLKTEEGLPFRKIAAWLKEHRGHDVSASTVQRVWKKSPESKTA